MERYHAGRRKGGRQTPPIRARCHRQIARGPLPTGIARAIGSGWRALHRNRTGPVSIHHNGIQIADQAVLLGRLPRQGQSRLGIVHLLAGVKRLGALPDLCTDH